MRKILLFSIIFITVIAILWHVNSKRIITDPLPETTNQEDTLRSLGYLSSFKPLHPEKAGVTKIIPEKSSDGINIYCERSDNIYLINNLGRILQKWKAPFHGHWDQAYLKSDGRILALSEYKGVVMMDWNSSIIWYRNFISHHMVVPLDTNTYLAAGMDEGLYNKRIIFFDKIYKLNDFGHMQVFWKATDYLDILRKIHGPSPIEEISKWRSKIQRSYPGDKWTHYHHLNAIQVLPPNKLAQRYDAFKEGNILLCLRQVNALIILDRVTKNIVWHWKNDAWEWPHFPYLLPDGTMLLFDNGRFRGYSRVLLLDPIKKEILWQYPKKPDKEFFSAYISMVQPLPNGHYLITLSLKGKVIEVTKDGEIVWEFYNPRFEGENRRIISFFWRYPKDYLQK